MKPVAWQHKAKMTGKWVTEREGKRLDMERKGYETRDLYEIPDGYVLVPVELTNAMADILRGHMSYQEAVMAWQDIIGLAQEESE